MQTAHHQTPNTKTHKIIIIYNLFGIRRSVDVYQSSRVPEYKISKHENYNLYEFNRIHVRIYIVSCLMPVYIVYYYVYR